MVRNIAASRQTAVMQQLRALFQNGDPATGCVRWRALGWRMLSAGIVTIAACAAPPLPPMNRDLPESLRVPPDDVLEDILTAGGEVVYRCDRGDQGLNWVYRGVQSTLVDSTGESVGTALPGGYFSSYDGSYVVSRPDAEATVSPDSLPWARLVARFNGGDKVFETRFARTGLILRVQTTGGLPPDRPCVLAGSVLNVPYTATYLMYRSPSVPAPAIPLPSASVAGAPERAVIPGSLNPQPGDFVKLPRNAALPDGALPLPDH
ncbi:DUF3455 domain-containing protein [Burkholderia ambifaria]